MQGASHPLVLGAATCYEPAQISVFVNSLKRSGFNGTTALLVDRSNVVLQDYLKKNGIEVILLDSTPRWMPAWFAERRCNGGRMHILHEGVAQFARLVPEPLQISYAVYFASAFHHICNSRHFYYLQFLQANAHRFSHAFLIDVRDVAFQSNPFAGVPDECLWFFQESASQTLGSQPVNRSWIEVAYGAEAFERIQKNGVLCAGTTMGSTKLLLEYLRMMTKEMVRLTARIAGNFGYDQAAHNWFYWTGMFPRAEVKQNFLGTVATLQLESPDLFQFDKKDRLLNRDGSPTPVLHQYDRHPAVTQRVMAQQAAG